MKYKWILLWCTLFFSAYGYAQDAKWDSTARPNSFEFQVSFFESYPDSNSDIIFLGNSITAGVNWNELLQLPQVRNRGISGDITFGVLERLQEVTKGKPAKIFILIGINDIARNIPDSVILNNYKRIIKTIKEQSPHTKIYWQTLLPVNNEFTPFKNHYNKDEHIQAVNNGLEIIAAKENITLIDLQPHFSDSKGRLNSSFTRDGLHLNAEGYKVWREVLLPYLKE